MTQIKKPLLSLKEFMVRKKVLNLYRDMLRCAREIPSLEDRQYMQEWIRADFKKNKHHTDEHAIKSLITYGERSLKELQQNLELSK